MLNRIIVFVALIALAAKVPAQAATCYGEHECNACKNCNYCGNCNSGGPKCGVYYESRGLTPPWAVAAKPAARLHHRRHIRTHHVHA